MLCLFYFRLCAALHQAVVDSWYIVIRLLQDDEESVRSDASEYVCAVACRTARGSTSLLWGASMDTSRALEVALSIRCKSCVL